jgi:hypothetical protein
MTTYLRWLSAAALAVAAASAVAFADAPASGQGGNGMMQHQPGIQHDGMTARGTPMQPGQAAFGTVQEIVRILEADPATDWTKVDMAGLREHLIDMDEVTMHAVAEEQAVDGGLRIEITGAGRTLAAIQRMVPAHAHELEHFPGWHAQTEPVSEGVVLTVTSTDPHQTARVRGLSFIGLMASGAHHQQHHLAMAKGEFQH